MRNFCKMEKLFYMTQVRLYFHSHISVMGHIERHTANVPRARPSAYVSAALGQGL